MRYLSVCSGIEAATVAWHPLGWTPAAFSEIEAFPSAVLAHHYPDVPNLGDMTQIKGADHAVDLLVGGTPCQAFSVAGLRKGLADPRGNLALTFLGIVDAARPRWVVWENVPGVLSSNGGRDFGAFLGGLGELGYGFAYRVLDAQYFGVAQRRRRVFVVGHSGGQWQRAAAVLFERHGLQGHPAPGREAGQGVTPVLASGAVGSNGCGIGRDGDPSFTLDTGSAMAVAQCLTTGTGRRYDPETETLVPVAFGWMNSPSQSMNPAAVSPTLDKSKHPAVLLPAGVTVHGTDGTTSVASYTQTASALRARIPGAIENSTTTAVHDVPGVRRLTPRECERLQGFPDDYTLIPYGSRGRPAADTPRYTAIGNSMAVPVMRWIGERIAAVDAI